MKIAIVGYAGQGKSAYDYWNTGEHELAICDRDENLQLPEGAAARLGDDHLKNLHEFDLIVRTPIIHPRQIAEANPNHPGIMARVTTVTNEFFRVCPTKNIIGVTGTKGKGTTSTLIAKILEAAGHKVHLGGNIGIPPLDMLKDGIQPDDWVVLELANFQLIDLKYSPPLAVCLMVVPEHMDWHADMDEYLAAKQQLFAHQKPSDTAIYYADNENSTKVASASPGKRIPYGLFPGAEVLERHITIAGHKLCHVDELKLLGQHNWQNACAAVTTVWQITQDISAIRQVLTTFTGLPFRLEFRGEINSIRYYNDSFAATPQAAAAAIASIPGHKVMLIGGFDRDLDLTELAETVANKAAEIRGIVAFGASRQRVLDSLQDKGVQVVLCDEPTMSAVLQTARSLAKPNDAIVLSPGFPSFDMFKNFEDRGRQFNEVIKQ